MRERQSQDFPRRRLLERCRAVHPRLTRLVARPGWGKTTFALQLAVAFGDFEVVDCREFGSAAELGARIAAVSKTADAIVVDSAERLVGEPDAVAALRRVLDEQSRDRRFIVASRSEIAVGAGRAVAPHHILSLGARDLAFDGAEIREIFAGLAVGEAALQRVIELTGGWPIGVFLFARVAREGHLVDALADLTHPSLDDLYAYAQRETVPFWTPDERLGLAAAVAIPAPTPDEIETAVGAEPRRALEAFAARTGPVRRDGDRFVVGELATAAVRRFLRAEVQSARDAAIGAAVDAHAYLRSAQIRFAAGDVLGAVDEMERLGRQAPSATPSPSYAKLAKRLPLQALLRSRNVLLAVLTDRETQANPRPLLAAVESFSRELRRDSDPELVAGNRAAYGALLRMAERFGEARAVLERALALGDPSPERTALVTANLAVVLAVAGEIHAARDLLAQADVPDVGPTLFPVERFEVELARDRLRADPARRRAAFERNVAEARFAGPVALSHALRYMAAGAWLDGDDVTVAAALAESRAAIDAQLSPDRRRVRASRPPLDAPHERCDRWTCVWYMSAALLEDDHETALRFVQVALDGYAEIGEPFLDVIASLVAASLSSDGSRVTDARARSNAERIGEPALIAAVQAILEERFADGGILLPLARRIERSRAARTSKLRVEVLSGRVHLGIELLALRERELELLVMLALERRALTREALATRLWPEIPSDEANAALRTAVYRLRRQLREPDAIVSTAAGYRLAESIPVDVLEAEQFVAGTRRLVALSERERVRLGTLLGRLSDGLPSVYERWEWFGSYEQRVRDLLHDVGVALAEDDLRRGDNDAAIARAKTLLRADELDEPANEVAIRAHVAAGRKSEALRRYRRYRDALQREYGVAPSSELSDLLEPR